MTTNNYRVLGTDQFTGIESYAIATGSGINTGDMIQWDTGSRIATLMVAVSGAIFLGVAETCQPLVGLGTTTVPLTGNRLRVRGQGTHGMNSTSGDTYSHLDP